MKRTLCFLLAVLMLGMLTACGTKTVHCDSCGEEIAIGADSNMDESWIIYCGECEEALFGNDPVVSPG